MGNLDLTDKERLILANQYDILAKLGDDESYALMATTLRAGHRWLYDQIFEHLSPNLSREDTDLVLKILEIYGALRSSYERLADKSGIEEHSLHFPGFDGNNESELLSFTNSLIKHGKFLATLGENAKNSHSPTVEIYGRMIRAWHTAGGPRYPYSKEVIQSILAARHRPDAPPA